MSKFTWGAIALAASVLATQVSAATVTVQTITGTWQDVTGSPTFLTGEGTESISWGTSTGSGQSGYDFDDATTPIENIAENVLFDLGEFVHRNRPISANTSITGATLKVVIDLLIGLTPQQVTSFYTFDHDETSNGANPCDYAGANNQGLNINGCADRVKATLNSGVSDTFTDGDDEYQFIIEGFEVGGVLFDQFLTKENAENSAVLRARYVLKECAVPNPTSDECSPPIDTPEVPLPAAGWLMIAGLGGLGAMARRRRN